jgi:hypothetical protein
VFLLLYLIDMKTSAAFQTVVFLGFVDIFTSQAFVLLTRQSVEKRPPAVGFIFRFHIPIPLVLYLLDALGDGWAKDNQ